MKSWQKCLILPSLTPLFVVLFLSFLNLNKPVRFKILIWNTPILSIGHWMAISSTSAATLTFLSGISSVNSRVRLRRKIKTKPIDNPSNLDDSDLAEEFDGTTSEFDSQDSFMPERQLRDPQPTVSVPFRIIRTRRDLSEDLNSETLDLEDELFSQEAEDSFPENEDTDIYKQQDEKDRTYNSTYDQPSQEHQDWINPDYEEW